MAGVLFGDCSSLSPFEEEIVFWNWKTASEIVNVLSDYPTDVAFLSRNHVMFGVEKPDEPSLIVVDITTLTSERQRLREVENKFTFHFPPFADTVQHVGVFIHPELAVACKSNPDFPVPFFTAQDPRNLLLIILVIPAGGLFHQVHLYALNHSFLTLIDTATGQNGADFDWEMWGPEGTRMMVNRSVPFNRAEISTPSGARHVSTGRQTTQPVDRIHIYDFNQYALRRSEQSKQEDASDEREEEAPSSYANVTAPTKIVDY